ncbi:general stress protein CsbD [Advenella sp. S44]|uniref:CsbD family protein n=1 Tax=Advenella sp. S44 TaxID=1982755 RepID=UPI000C2A1509|nr:CsbD family protein [Advenella sp. S44]PJX25962.1 general stress protein CsbD [Advenella sp. S44]
MNKDIAQGKWAQLKGSIKQTWGNLTDSDIAQVNGDAQKMCGLLQETYGISQEVAQREVDDFWSRHNHP